MQYHLGYYETEEEAARVFDRASIVRGIDKRRTRTNFDIKLYEQELPFIFDVSLKELQVCLDDERYYTLLHTHTIKYLFTEYRKKGPL